MAEETQQSEGASKQHPHLQEIVQKVAYTLYALEQQGMSGEITFKFAVRSGEVQKDSIKRTIEEFV